MLTSVGATFTGFVCVGPMGLLERAENQLRDPSPKAAHNIPHSVKQKNKCPVLANLLAS
jgi:hypothetical protein